MEERAATAACGSTRSSSAVGRARSCAAIRASASTIGARARAELEGLLDRRVHLFLFVKVRDNWIEDPERFAAMGLDYNV